jgi:hypothetical protein
MRRHRKDLRGRIWAMATDATNSSEEQPPRASLRKVKPEYVRNGHDDVLYFTQATHMPSDVFAYGREAPNCFDQRRYLATIILASFCRKTIEN